jgi:hypothetical protein
MMQASVTTYQAYNAWGQEAITATNPTYTGKSLYDNKSSTSCLVASATCTDGVSTTGGVTARKVSFNRPYADIYNGRGAGQFFGFEVRMLRFLEREGYDVVYSTNIDTHTAGAQLTRYRGFLSVGHDEYWTKQMRDNLEAARDNKVNLGFFGANAGYWQIRLESATATGDANRTIVGYKSASLDPLTATNPAESSVKFRDAHIGRPEASLIGVMYDYDPVVDDMVMANCIPWICKGTNLVNGSHLPSMLGYELDRVDASSPSNIQIIASSPYNVTVNSVVTTRYANMTYYQAPSGATVFATGSMYWNYGLDAYLAKLTLVNADVQQITRNVLDSFVPVPPKALAAGSVKALPIGNSTAASDAVGGGCAFHNGLTKSPDISLLMLLLVNLIWGWKRKIFLL